MWRGRTGQRVKASRPRGSHERAGGFHVGAAAFGAHGRGMGGSVMLLNVWSTPRKKPSRIRPTNLPEPCTCDIKAILQTERKGRVACRPGWGGIRAHGTWCPRWGGGAPVPGLPLAGGRCGQGSSAVPSRHPEGRQAVPLQRAAEVSVTVKSQVGPLGCFQLQRP